ncbi:hypothetical protein CWI42_090560 [Ordospora colligata]|uniref:Uncharacterized protein n=1 Tax=Ordospora colligata OC4 TaxID=1354746 RepID=A0A0B2UDI9_9MICR|nr:uncharacterized protein M896_090560 [Ordospora colligata OC4]KHN69131.1 hypothetical protein M896_090560 [Ordospora colligata OC4]TBU14586.1 hypothetical protein CWI41_090560 [Ordospora colligata]TBU14780.1 hypothetical protein CWI40_090570 [Ordospora colligata]TBU18214.1 hypothetical protein CWI42_090560 [Ordospora colligata]
MKIWTVGKFELNQWTLRFLTAILTTSGVIVYMLCCSHDDEGYGVHMVGTELQTSTYIYASDEGKRSLIANKDDLDGTYFSLVLVNFDRNKVVMVVNGTKLKTIESSNYVKKIVELVGNDTTQFMFLFLSYLIGSMYFPVGSINFVMNSEGIWYNGVHHESHPFVFRRICTMLIRDIK